jgi:hypothetical protein
MIEDGRVRSLLNGMPDYVMDAEAEPDVTIGAVNGWIHLRSHFSPGPRIGDYSLAELTSAS